MATKFTAVFVLFTIAVVFLTLGQIKCNPAIDGMKLKDHRTEIEQSNKLFNWLYIDKVYQEVVFRCEKKWHYNKSTTGFDAMEVCIENCAQCKKMLGAWFEGPLCAESCIKFKGKLIPECEDFASISPFLNKL